MAALARIGVALLIVSVAVVALPLPVEPSNSLAETSDDCAYVASTGECQRCASDLDTHNSAAASTCYSCQACCLVLYLTNAISFVAPTSLIGLIGKIDQHASARSQRPPVPPPRTAFS